MQDLMSSVSTELYSSYMASAEYREKSIFS